MKCNKKNKNKNNNISNNGTIDLSVSINIDDNDKDDDDNDKSNADDLKNKFKNFVGTNLFFNDGIYKKCFSPDEVALLSTRREFEYFVPKQVECKDLINSKLLEIYMKYFRNINDIIMESTSGNAKIALKQAFYDTFGGFLNYYLVPITKLSYYAGTVTLQKAKSIFKLLKKSKEYLNTNGNGWRLPIELLYSDLLNSTSIELLKLKPKTKGHNKSCEENDPSSSSSSSSSSSAVSLPCVNLDLYNEKFNDINDNSNLIVSLPKLLTTNEFNNDDYDDNVSDNDDEDTSDDDNALNIWLPYKNQRYFNLKSTTSAYILLKYFIDVTKCYNYQNLCQNSFNRNYLEWLYDNIDYYLNDIHLYPGFGGILRVIKTLQIENDKQQQKHNHKHHNKIRASDNQYSKTDFELSNKVLNLNHNHHLKYKPNSIKYQKFGHKLNNFNVDGSNKKIDNSRIPDSTDDSYNNNNEMSLDSSSQSSSQSLSPSSLKIKSKIQNTEWNENYGQIDDDDDIKNSSSNVNSIRQKYLVISIIVVIALLVFILIIAVITKYMKDDYISKTTLDKNKKKSDKNQKYEKIDIENEGSNKGNFCSRRCKWLTFLCCCLCCRKKSDSKKTHDSKDNLIKNDDPSIMVSTTTIDNKQLNKNRLHQNTTLHYEKETSSKESSPIASRRGTAPAKKCCLGSSCISPSKGKSQQNDDEYYFGQQLPSSKNLTKKPTFIINDKINNNNNKRKFSISKKPKILK